MMRRWQARSLTAVAALTLLLALANASLLALNRRLQGELHERQQFIQQSVQLEAIYRELVKGLAEVGVKTKDQQILNMLNAQGLSISVNNAAPTVGETRK